MYTINIMPEPEVFNGKPMYFWMIEGQSGETHYNCGRQLPATEVARLRAH